MEIRSLKSGEGVQWIVDGFALFKKNPLIWIIITIIFLAVLTLLSLIPFVGSIAGLLLQPVLIGGQLLGCRDLEQGRELRIEHLFDGFRDSTQPLVMIGVYSGLAYLLIGLVVFLVLGAGALSLHFLAGVELGQDLTLLGMLVGVLLAVLLAVPVAMAVWLAPALVLFRRVAPLDAMRLSFQACLRNLWPFLAYGAVALLFGLLALIPAGLGLLVLCPTLLASVYTGYRSIFADQP